MTNDHNESLVPIQYDSITAINDRAFLVEKAAHWGLINDANKTVVPIEYDEGERLDATTVGLKENDSWTVFSDLGQKVFSTTFQELAPIREDLIAVRADDKWGAINSQGKVLIPIKFDKAPYIYMGGILFSLEGNRYLFSVKTAKGVQCETGDEYNYMYCQALLRQYTEV